MGRTPLRCQPQVHSCDHRGWWRRVVPRAANQQGLSLTTPGLLDPIHIVDAFCIGEYLINTSQVPPYLISDNTAPDLQRLHLAKAMISNSYLSTKVLVRYWTHTLHRA